MPSGRRGLSGFILQNVDRTTYREIGRLIEHGSPETGTALCLIWSRAPMTNESMYHKFLPISIGNVNVAVRVDDLTVGDIKSAAREAQKRDVTRSLKYNTALNHIVRSLGFEDSFSAFQGTHSEKLRIFQINHGFIQRKTLIAPPLDPIVKLNYRQISDRFFNSETPVPQRIFTGVGSDYDAFLRAAEVQNNKKVCDVSDLWMGFKDVESINSTDRNPLVHYSVCSHDAYLMHCNIINFWNLIGDQLCDFGTGPNHDRPIATLYNLTAGDEILIPAQLRLFREVISNMSEGWVDVVPYSENLIFLSDGTGGYDFVFRGLRHEDYLSPPNTRHMPMGMTITPDADTAFTKLMYLHYNGWYERDLHEADQAFYRDGGNVSNYPGIPAVWRAHFSRTGQNSGRVGCSQVVDQTARTVSALTKLITIKEFRWFMKENPDYRSHRKIEDDGDPWLQVNHPSHDDADLPVAVNWYDATAYADWCNRRNPKESGTQFFRLPTECEYRSFFEDLIPKAISRENIDDAYQNSILRFIDPKGKEYRGHPPDMPREEFARWCLAYRAPLPWKIGVKGIPLIESVQFGEWLEAEGAAINGLFFCSLYDTWFAHECIVSAMTGRWSPGSTGKYKAKKIGFRLAILK